MTEPAGFAGRVYREDLQGLGSAGFAVCAFFTPGDGFERYADRLAASCRNFGLPFSIWLAPAIHQSVTLRGSPDLRFTKSSFINACLDQLGGAGVAYLDVDTVITAQPGSFAAARSGGYDFAIYNWFADPHNEAYLPAGNKLWSREPGASLYLFSHRVERHCPEQLNCSGVTQYYASTPGARALLARWQAVIAANPRSADDQCLNFAFNNPGPDQPPLRVLWLDKAYARCPWWPHVEPVVLHPAIPAQVQPFAPVREVDGQRSIYPERCPANEQAPLFPRDGGVDTRSGVVFRLDAERRPQPVGRYPGRFWIFSEDGVALPPG